MKTIDLKMYRENKDTCRCLRKINQILEENFSEKTWGWVGLTTLLYSQLAIENYVANEAELDPQFIPAVKSVLWQFMNELGRHETRRKEK